LVFVLLRRLNFATIAGLFPLTNPGLELLLALKPPPPTFGVILGLGAPGTPGGLRVLGLGAILLRLFLLAAPAAPAEPGLWE
jgi:hypothetical protein